MDNKENKPDDFLPTILGLCLGGGLCLLLGYFGCFNAIFKLLN